MRHVMAALLGGLVLAGALQGCTSASAGTDRLGVTATLRQACGGASDTEIQTVIDMVEVARVNGATQETALLAFSQGCSGDAATAGPCMACTTAIINQVYTQ